MHLVIGTLFYKKIYDIANYKPSPASLIFSKQEIFFESLALKKCYIGILVKLNIPNV